MKRQRRTAGRQRDRLAVEDQLARRHALQRLDDFGHRCRDIVQVARVDLDLVAGLVDLNARAVDLPFERRGAQARQRIGDVVGRLREHRLHRPMQCDGVARECARPFRQRDTSDKA